MAQIGVPVRACRRSLPWSRPCGGGCGWAVGSCCWTFWVSRSLLGWGGRRSGGVQHLGRAGGSGTWWLGGLRRLGSAGRACLAGWWPAGLWGLGWWRFRLGLRRVGPLTRGRWLRCGWPGGWPGSVFLRRGRLPGTTTGAVRGWSWFGGALSGSVSRGSRPVMWGLVAGSWEGLPGGAAVGGGGRGCCERGGGVEDGAQAWAEVGDGGRLPMWPRSWGPGRPVGSGAGLSGGGGA